LELRDQGRLRRLQARQSKRVDLLVAPRADHRDHADAAVVLDAKDDSISAIAHDHSAKTTEVARKLGAFEEPVSGASD